MDIPEDEETPIFLGRPFMLTSRCNFDIEIGNLTLKLFDEEITLKVLEIKKQGSGEKNQASAGMIKISRRQQKFETTPRKNLQHKLSGGISKNF